MKDIISLSLYTQRIIRSNIIYFLDPPLLTFRSNKRNFLNIPPLSFTLYLRITSPDPTLRKFHILFCYIYIYKEKDIQANTTTNQHRNGFHLVAKHSVTSFPHSVYTIIPSRFQGMDLIKETWVQTKSARRTDSGKSGSRKLSRKRIGAVKPGGGGFYRFNISLFHDWTGGNAGYKEAEDTIPQRGYSGMRLYGLPLSNYPPSSSFFSSSPLAGVFSTGRGTKVPRSRLRGSNNIRARR